jgi:isoamyl acetate esterase
MLITNPPIDEQKQFMLDQQKGYPRRRTAENTKAYADAIRGVGKDLGVPVCDLWTAIMLEAGWEPNSTDPLPGCADAPHSAVLERYLSDGRLKLSC